MLKKQPQPKNNNDKPGLRPPKQPQRPGKPPVLQRRPPRQPGR